MLTNGTSTTEQATAERRMEAWRCWNCARLLAKIYLAVGSKVEIRCQCKATNIIGS